MKAEKRRKYDTFYNRETPPTLISVPHVLCIAVVIIGRLRQLGSTCFERVVRATGRGRQAMIRTQTDSFASGMTMVTGRCSELLDIYGAK